MDALRNAYATLELSPGAEKGEVRRQFRKLVRQWHPDRFPGDPQGQGEAARHVRQIYEAYRRIRESGRSAPAGASPPDPTPPQSPARNESLDWRTVVLDTRSDFDYIVDFLAWTWPLYLALLLDRGRGHQSRAEFVGQMLLIALAGLLWLWRRRGRRTNPLGSRATRNARES